MILILNFELALVLLINYFQFAGEVFNFPNKLSLRGVKIVDIACGRSHILMLSEKGDVYSVGEGRFVGSYLFLSGFGHFFFLYSGTVISGPFGK